MEPLHSASIIYEQGIPMTNTTIIPETTTYEIPSTDELLQATETEFGKAGYNFLSHWRPRLDQILAVASREEYGFELKSLFSFVQFMLDLPRLDILGEYDIKMCLNGVFSVYIVNDSGKEGYTSIEFLPEGTYMFSSYDPDLDIPGGRAEMFDSPVELIGMFEVQHAVGT